MKPLSPEMCKHSISKKINFLQFKAEIQSPASDATVIAVIKGISLTSFCPLIDACCFKCIFSQRYSTFVKVYHCFQKVQLLYKYRVLLQAAGPQTYNQYIHTLITLQHPRAKHIL